jgi:hypothetical protein
MQNPDFYLVIFKKIQKKTIPRVNRYFFVGHSIFLRKAKTAYVYYIYAIVPYPRNGRYEQQAVQWHLQSQIGHVTQHRDRRKTYEDKKKFPVPYHCGIPADIHSFPAGAF